MKTLLIASLVLVSHVASAAEFRCTINTNTYSSSGERINEIAANDVEVPADGTFRIYPVGLRAAVVARIGAVNDAAIWDGYLDLTAYFVADRSALESAASATVGDHPAISGTFLEESPRFQLQSGGDRFMNALCERAPTGSPLGFGRR